ncbi:hypothetical protein O0I10_010175 [Lichtheimia ornata]|uniref:Cytochrome p450 n=1 Tax=Lichtheimia ornata TaxID=688661 RepID=A0AAD7UVN2_9FUNG|nr:uncharacterized protein O0I10_010175 [Lichtheimia ornata]KAJ8654100.1 hypothetical protein O0I10_010175 [Lichtheimia ornata]
MSAILDTFTSQQNPTLRIAAATSGAAAAILGALALKYNDRAVFRERPKGVTFVPGHPLIGTLWMQLSNKHRIYDALLENFEKYDAVTIADSVIFMPPAVLSVSPENIEYVLKTNFSNYVKGQQMRDALGDLFGHGIFVANGEGWKYQRKTASVLFNVVNFRDHFTDVFVKELHVMAEHIFDKKADNGKTVDFHDVMHKFTLDSFVLIGFGSQLNGLLSKRKVPFAESFDICQANCLDRFIDPFNGLKEFLHPILSPHTPSIRQHLKIIDDFAYRMVAERRAEGAVHKDLLSRFMNTHNDRGEPLSDKELRDTVLNFIIAGRDTTAQALSWTFYNLMLHPRVERKLLNEIKECIHEEHESNSPALYEAIRKMTYAHAVFYEVLRLYPSVPSNVKVALEDDILPDGTPMRKGDTFTWSPYSQGRSTRVWGPDAKSFRPERWIDEEGNVRRENPGQWPAFHAGPRVCLGQNLATLEALVAIVFLLKRYKFTLAPDQEVTYEPSLTLRMLNGMFVHIEHRTDF